MYEKGTFHFHEEGQIIYPAVTDLCNTFTYECWVKAAENHTLDMEKDEGIDGISGKKYIVGPQCYPSGEAGAGISIGKNGISVYEHSIDYLPARVVIPYDFSDWHHVAVIYEENKVQVYIDGCLCRESSNKTARRIFPSLNLGGCQYGKFKGQMREFRLWSTARKGEEIKAMMFNRLNGDEQGLYFYIDPERGINVKHGMKQDIRVSVIMPSKNKMPLNFFALLTLHNQSYPADRTEILLMDDASTDPTPLIPDMLKMMKNLVYVRYDHTLGRSGIRNAGAKLASGRIFIFTDAEMLCPRHYIEAHASHHENSDAMVVSGSLREKRVYTIAFSGFNKSQKERLSDVYAGHPVAGPQVSHFLVHDQIDMQLLPTEMICMPEELEPWSLETSYFTDILEVYGPRLVNFCYSWLNLVTNNVSMSRRMFQASGEFDSSFEGYGWEDWELGYRAALNGAVFLHDDRVINYHQEHPVYTDNLSQSLRNFVTFCRKYKGHYEVSLLALTLPPHGMSFSTIHAYCLEMKNLFAVYQDRCLNFGLFIQRALDFLVDRLDLGDVAWTKDVIEGLDLRVVQKEADAISKLNVFSSLIQLYNYLYTFCISYERSSL